MSGPRLRPVRFTGQKAVHLVMPAGSRPLCGISDTGFRAVGSPSEHFCNACHAEACRIKGTIGWKPKEPAA